MLSGRQAGAAGVFIMVVTVGLVAQGRGRLVGSAPAKLLEGVPGGRDTAKAGWDGMLAWAASSRSRSTHAARLVLGGAARTKQGALQRLELKHSSGSHPAPNAALERPTDRASRQASSIYEWLAPCSDRVQTGCLRQDATTLTAHSTTSWQAPDVSKFDLSLSRYAYLWISTLAPLQRPLAEHKISYARTRSALLILIQSGRCGLLPTYICRLRQSRQENPPTPRPDQLPMGSSAMTWANIVSFAAVQLCSIWRYAGIVPNVDSLMRRSRIKKTFSFAHSTSGPTVNGLFESLCCARYNVSARY